MSPGVRGRTGLVTGLVTVLVLSLAPAVSAGPATQERPDRTRTDVETGPRLVLEDQTFVLAVDDVLQLDYRLNGDLAVLQDAIDAILDPPAAPPDDDTGDDTGDQTGDDTGDDTGGADGRDASSGVEVVVTSYEPISERGRVAGVLAGATGPAIDGARFDLAEVLDVEEEPPRLRLDVVTALDGDRARELELPVAGLYPITVDLREPDGRRLLRHTTFVERLTAPDERARRTAPYQLAVVAAIADPGPEPTRLELLEARTRLVELAQLGEALGPLTVSVPPSIAPHLGRGDDPERDGPSGDDVGDELTDELTERLRAALEGSEILAAPALEFDPSAAVAADLADAYVRQLRDGEDQLKAAFPATTVRRSAWLWDRPLSGDGAAMLRDLGVPLVVVPLEDWFELDGALPPEFTDPSLLYRAVLPGGATASVAMIDPVSALLDPVRDDPRSSTEVAIELVATLVAMRHQLPDAPRTTVLSTDAFGVPDADVLTAVRQLVDQHPHLRSQTLSFVPGSTDTMRVNGEVREIRFPDTAGPDLQPRADRVRLTAELVSSLGSVLPVDDPRLDRWRAELDRLLTSGYTERVADERIDAVIAAVEDVPTAIVPPDPFTFTLTGTESDVTLRFGNTGPVPLRVVLRPEASKLTFPRDEMEVVLEPGTTNVTVPVTALSNGTFPVTIDVLTPADHREVIEPIVLTARVNALTGLGQVLTGGALLVLASWWYSHLRNRRRRERHRARHTHPSSADSVATP